jgi:hypothetical protein
MGVVDRAIRRRVQDLADTAMDAILRERSLRAHRPHFDHGHWLVSVEDDSPRVSIASRNIGEPFYVATQPVVRRLHYECTDLTLAHRPTHGGPTPLQIGIRDPGKNPLDCGRCRAHSCSQLVTLQSHAMTTLEVRAAKLPFASVDDRDICRLIGNPRCDTPSDGAWRPNATRRHWHSRVGQALRAIPR